MFGLDGIRGVINLDTVGRLGDGRITVLATGTADEWQHVFRGVGFVTGIDSRNVPQSLDASDQVSFIEKGIPAVQIFTEAHADYHRPTDTADKVDMAGLVKIATFVKEATAYMVEREEPLTVTIAAAGDDDKTRPKAPASGRKVSFGTVPEFAFQGPGVQVSSLVPGSPAEKAGIQAGDVLTRIDDREVEDLRGFSEILKTLEAGQTVTATVVRGAEELQLEVTVTAR
jgi:C-terminal processing protease CtpA/Prc